MRVLDRADWQAREAEHVARADELTAAHRARAVRGESHPVEDFLFTYYSYRPSLLRRWHPGVDVVMEDAAGSARAAWRWYRTGTRPGSVAVDADAFRAARADLIESIRDVLRSTAGRPARYGCFGLHEWAMVYREDEHRHPIPLRLGRAGSDAVVEAHELRCTHYDAYRFFTPGAVPRNADELARESQAQHEQPGCLHANMDLYKWSAKLGPLVPGELLLDAFELARDIRYLDMQASPYEMSRWAGESVPIETSDGKAEYVRRQRGFADRATAIRARLIDVVGE